MPAVPLDKGTDSPCHGSPIPHAYSDCVVYHWRDTQSLTVFGGQNSKGSLGNSRARASIKMSARELPERDTNL